MAPKTQYFRANVGIAVLNPDRRVLVFERFDIPGAWQLPQGGLDRGEEPLSAALRELAEETGIAAEQVELLGEHPEWLTYELPAGVRSDKPWRGQAQKWFAFGWRGVEEDIQLTGQGQEFSSFQWMSPHDLLDVVADFRRPVYSRLVTWIESL